MADVGVSAAPNLLQYRDFCSFSFSVSSTLLVLSPIPGLAPAHSSLDVYPGFSWEWMLWRKEMLLPPVLSVMSSIFRIKICYLLNNKVLPSRNEKAVKFRVLQSILPIVWLLTVGLLVFLLQKAYIFTFLLSSRLFIEPHELLSRVCHKCIEQQRLDDPVLDKVSLSLQQKNMRYFQWVEDSGALVCALASL